MLSSARSITATLVNHVGATSGSGLSCATSLLPSLSVHWKLSISPFCTWFLSSWLITAYSPSSAWSAISGAMKVRVSFSSRLRRAECSAAPSATSRAVCTPPPVMIAMPTASMRRDTSPQSFQNRMRPLLIFPSPVTCLSPAGLLHLRRAVEVAMVVVVAVFGRDEAELAGALQQLGAGLEHLAALGIVDHVDQCRAHRGHLVGGHLGVRHDAQVLIDLGSPQRAVGERLAARIALHDRAVHTRGLHLAHPQLGRRSLLVAGEYHVDLHSGLEQRVHRQPIAREGVRRHEGDVLAVQVVQRLH